MARRRESSAESAARFLASYRPSARVKRYRAIQEHHREKRMKKNADDRIKLDMARATVAECLDCVSARINDCHARNVEPDHITNIAWQMLNDALHRGP